MLRIMLKNYIYLVVLFFIFGCLIGYIFITPRGLIGNDNVGVGGLIGIIFVTLSCLFVALAHLFVVLIRIFVALIHMFFGQPSNPDKKTE